jgi:hypothetical protein
MKLLSFILFNIVHSTKIITNNYPSCKNCIYHKPAFSDNYASLFSKCTKFGNKNIITGEITNNYADSVRNDKKLCGINGIYFEMDNYVEFKKITYYIIHPNTIYIAAYISLIVLYLKFVKIN